MSTEYYTMDRKYLGVFACTYNGQNTCQTFHWAVSPANVVAKAEANPSKVMFLDEYNREMTGAMFLDMLGKQLFHNLRLSTLR